MMRFVSSAVAARRAAHRGSPGLWSLLSLGALLLPACVASQSGAAAGAEPRLLGSAGYTQCPWLADQPGLSQVRDSSAWQQLLAQAKPSATALASWAPQFEAQRVVIYRLGNKPSSGYGAQAQAPGFDAGVLRLPIVQAQPATGTLQATLITSPCVVAWLQGPANAPLRVVDAQSGAVLAE